MRREREHSFYMANFHRQGLRVGQKYCFLSNNLTIRKYLWLYSLPSQPLFSFPFSSFSPRLAFHLPPCMMAFCSHILSSEENRKATKAMQNVNCFFIHKGAHFTRGQRYDRCTQIASYKNSET